MRTQHPLRTVSLFALALAAAGLAGCAKTTRPEITHAVPLTSEQRHPINVGYQTSDLSIYPDIAAQGMSPKDRTALIGFLRAYRNDAKTILQVIMPSGSANEGLTYSILGEIRVLAADEGIEQENIIVRPYSGAGQPNPPVHLSYGEFAASTPQCGLWPRTLNAGPQNLEYYNFGCATQQNLAEMVSDPRDLTGPRAEEPADPNRRRTVFDKYRQGQDTATIRNDPNAGTASKVSE
ncbi:MAG: CpaD family pilus assembly protein [Rhodobiaceae bacterium]|nr:CpaD family pilus assembly protein [Rhodobiaceae bacterium]MCC0055141.1 CpaD family pilus assembly protein [Rhodobiaceae bacterium]